LKPSKTAGRRKAGAYDVFCHSAESVIKLWRQSSYMP
jgi:hypothetical protein